MLSKLEELKLISQCALADNRRAFGRLAEAYRPQLCRFLLNLTGGDVFLSDDLAQETMVKAYINIRSFKGLSSFGTWLYRIAYNEFYNEKRRRHEESMPTMDTSGSDSPRPIEHPAINSTHMTETQLTVHAALQCLNDNERTAVTLFYIEDLPIKKIAVIMQCSEGNIKSMLHRGKAKMGKYINFEQNYNLI